MALMQTRVEGEGITAKVSFARHPLRSRWRGRLASSSYAKELQVLCCMCWVFQVHYPMDTSFSTHVVVFLHISTGSISRVVQSQGSKNRKGDNKHGTLHDSIYLHPRGMGNAGEEPTRPQYTHQGNGAEARWTVGRPLLLLW